MSTKCAPDTDAGSLRFTRDTQRIIVRHCLTDREGLGVYG